MDRSTVGFLGAVSLAVLLMLLSVGITKSAVRGDADCDNSVTILDSQLIARVDAGLEEFPQGGASAADVDRDGSVTILDAQLVARVDAGLEEFPPDGRPTASFTYSPTSPAPGENVTFDASGSSDNDGTIDNYDWHFGDGDTDSGVTVTHAYSSTGIYTVTLTVTDNDGLTDSTTQTVTVTPGSQPSRNWNLIETWTGTTTTSQPSNFAPVVENQKTEGQVNPTHLTTFTPTLSWNYADADSDAQAQRQIQVGTSENGNDMWDSTASTSSMSAAYAGSALSSGVTYHWRVRIYDGYEWSNWLYGGTFRIEGWSLIETWTGTVSAPAEWNLIETWTGTVASQTPPNKPTNLLPSTHQTTTDAEISCVVTDNNGDNINVFFYDNSDNSLIDNVWVETGATAQVTWSGLTRGNTYTFFAGGQDNNDNWGENSDTCSFLVNSLPIAENQKTEGQVTPTRLTTFTPTLSCNYADADSDAQAQRQIQVGTSENGNDMWDNTVAWLAGWQYRKKQTMTGSTAGAQTNYQMKMTVHKGSGTDSATDVYCGGACRDDFGDIRWTQGDGTTLMDYWIGSLVSGDSAVFWVEVPSITASPGTVDVYIYYGKSDATSLSSGDNTFTFFDDFTGTNGSPPNTAKWTVTTASVTINGNKMRISGADACVSPIPTFSQPFTVEYKYTPITDGYPYYSDFSHYLLTLNGYDVRIIFNHKHNRGPFTNMIRIYSSGEGDLITSVANPAIVHGTEYAIKIMIDNVNKRIKIYVDNVLKVDYDASAKTFGTNNVSLATSTQTDDVDTYRFCKYVSPEPTWGAWGSQESSTSAISATYAGTSLSRGVTYHWRVRVHDGYEWSSWRYGATFRINQLPFAENQRTEGLVNPTYLTTFTPTLSCNYADADSDAQAQRQIQVGTSENGNDMQDSTVSTSSASAAYAGPARLRSTTYHWRARVYDGYEWSSWLYGGTFRLAPPTSPHATILIIGNDSFTPANGVNGGGDGTKDNAYIIENWAINASSAHGIQIQNTTKYFIVRNCLVENGRSIGYLGIYLDNVINGKIERNTCENNSIGIYLESSDNNTLTGNNCSNNYEGIYLYSSSSNNLTGNTCSNTDYGILLESSDNNTLTGNNCSNNYEGIYLYSSSSNNTLTGNTCENNYDYGIFLYDSDNNTLTGNTCENNYSRGIFLSGSNNTLTGNTCRNNSDSGIYLESSDNNTLTGNTCENNNYGIFLSGSYNTLTGNTCSNNYYHGIFLSGSNNTLSNNTCSFNWNPAYGGYGITLYGSNNTLTNNTCENNSYGIALRDSSYNTLTNNTCSYDTYGIHMYSYVDYNTMTGNTCSNNDTGIYMGWESDNNTMTGNTCEHNYSRGIDLVCADNNNLINNNLINNLGGWMDTGVLHGWVGGYGISLSSSSNNTLTNNTCENNRQGICLESSSNNTLTNNTIKNTSNYGIHLSGGRHNNVTNNTCENNCFGIGLYSSYNTLTNNTFENNQYGIRIAFDSLGFKVSFNNNTITLNRLLNNTTNAYDEFTNYWDNNGKGNYWSDWSGSGWYYIPGGGGNVDHFPLVIP